MIQLPRDQYEEILPMFAEMDHHLSVAGVLSGAIAGRAWLNGSGTCALVQSPQGFLFGGKPDTVFFSDCARLMGSELLPELAAVKKLDYVVFFPEGWRAMLTEAFSELEPMPSTRMTWERDLAGADLALPPDVRPVTLELLARGDLEGVDWTLEEIAGGWPSAEEFCRRGFGCVAVEEREGRERIVAWCLTDWVVRDRCELGIEVEEDCRLQGYGRRVALGTVALACARGIGRIGWQCWASNMGSQGVARAAGFRLAREFPVLFGWNNPMNNTLINGNYYLNDHPDVSVTKDYRRAALAYARALDQGWDWGGNPILYYNTACLFARSGEWERARRYMVLAMEKGFNGIEGKPGTWEWEYTYHERDAEEIVGRLR